MKSNIKGQVAMEKRLCSFYKKKKVLIPGGAGFIGSNLARRLAGLGANVVIVDSFDPLCGGNRFNIEGISGKAIFVKNKIEDFIVKNSIKRYDAIFNCIGLTNHHIGLVDRESDYRINCSSGLKLLLKLAGEHAKTKMVSIGSRSQYGRVEKRRAIDESYPLDPIDVQATHKAILEFYNETFARHFELALIFVRMTNVFGPRQRLHGEGIGTIGEMIRSGLLSRDITVYGSTRRIKDILFVDDAVNGLLLLGMTGKKDFAVYNLGGKPCPVGKLADAIKRQTNAPVKVVPFPDKIKKLDSGDVVLKTDRIAKATGWQPRVSVDEGIEITIDYYLRHRRYYL